METDPAQVWEDWYRNNPNFWKGSPFTLPDLKVGARILDIGCGTGNTMIQAHEKGYDPVGIDLSPTAVARAKERLEKRGIYPGVQVGNILRDREGLGDFDCILLHHVLDSMIMKDRKEAVKVCMDHLVEGGIISFQDFSVNDLRFGKGRSIEENTFLKGDGLIIHFFTLEETRKLFRGMKELFIEERTWDQSRGRTAMKRARINARFQLLPGSTLGRESGAPTGLNVLESTKTPI